MADAVGVVGSELDMRVNVRTLADALAAFAEHGWAVSATYAPLDTLRAAVLTFDSSGLEPAELVLAEGWGRRPTMLSALGFRLPAFVPVDDECRAVFENRARLVRLAWDHHEAGSWEASVPIVLAQVEGLTADACDGKLFFSRRTDRQAPVVDAVTLAGMDECLPVVREWFSDSVQVSCTSGGGGRHAVLHGREVRYDHAVSSTKCFALLAAVMEHTEPLVAEQSRLRRLEREARWAGSTEIDELGRRCDRREFPEVTQLLRKLAQTQFINRTTRNRFAGRPPGAPVDSEVFRLEVSSDGSRWWAWARTVTGWTFGVAGEANAEWRIDGSGPPSDGPWAAGGWVPDEEASLNWLDEDILSTVSDVGTT
jgi:hypothetical protein